MKYLTPLKLSIYGGMIFSFFMLESPVIMLANRIEPMVLGIPFLIPESVRPAPGSTSNPLTCMAI